MAPWTILEDALCKGTEFHPFSGVKRMKKVPFLNVVLQITQKSFLRLRDRAAEVSKL